MNPPLRVVLLTTDNREQHKRYDRPKPYFGTAPEALLQGLAQLAGVEVHVVSCVRQPMPSPEKLAGNIWFHPLVVPKLGWMTTAYQGCIRAVRRKLRELQPDIVHGQGTERDCAITAVFSGFPNVLTIHGNMRLIAKVNHDPAFSYHWLNARLEAFTIPRSRGVVCITRYTQEAVRNLARRTWVVPNAVDARYFDVPASRAEPPVILCVGFICHRKNQNRLIRALDPLAARRALRLRFLGAVPEDGYGAEFRALLADRPWCEHGGFADRDELALELSRASALALPSLEDNCPMAVLEGMAAGVPVVGARVGGVPDLIDDGVTGLFCDPLDERSMAVAVEALIGDPTRVSALGAAAREKARRCFTPRIVAEQHLEIYREVLSTPA